MKLSRFDGRLFSKSFISACEAEKAFVHDNLRAPKFFTRPDAKGDFRPWGDSSDSGRVETFADGSLFLHSSGVDEIWKNSDDFKMEYSLDDAFQVEE